MTYLTPRVLLAAGICLLLPFRGNMASPLDNFSTLPLKVSQYLERYYYLANQLYIEKGIPKAITLAMAGLESDWGTSELALNGNNHFGVKVKEWTGPVYCLNTNEWDPASKSLKPEKDCFRKYPLIAHSYQDFGNFLASRPYFSTLILYPTWDYPSWVRQIQSGGYATDPNYGKKLLRLIETYELYHYDQFR